MNINYKQNGEVLPAHAHRDPKESLVCINLQFNLLPWLMLKVVQVWNPTSGCEGDPGSAAAVGGDGDYGVTFCMED